eukprot:TRINITY_DN13910_c0_g1_i1.p1 TRINITY_DN13910_c0_g1~~TRINITY_DN13910_c0_g1_i1.p1  ORF type:complete len:416 (-),score=61.29 TRINITY_DN13910_c0_g1_i1:123-1283(-)
MTPTESILCRRDNFDFAAEKEKLIRKEKVLAQKEKRLEKKKERLSKIQERFDEQKKLNLTDAELIELQERLKAEDEALHAELLKLKAKQERFYHPDEIAFLELLDDLQYARTQSLAIIGTIGGISNPNYTSHFERIRLVACTAKNCDLILMLPDSNDKQRISDDIATFTSLPCEEYYARAGEFPFGTVKFVSKTAEPIGALREEARRVAYELHRAGAYFDVVLAMDFSHTLRIPKPEYIHSTIHALAQREVICAHGRLLDRSFSDLSSLVLRDADKPPENSKGLSEKIEDSELGFFSIQSCYGGVVLYQAKSFFKEDCHYSKRSALVSESVRFNMCVCDGKDDAEQRCVVYNKLETLRLDTTIRDRTKVSEEDIIRYISTFQTNYI